MRRPVWVALLVVAITVAGVFAWLGQWQASRAVSAHNDDSTVSEQLLPIEQIAQPGAAVYDDQLGQRVDVSGTRIGGTATVISNRDNGGAIGWWVVTMLVQPAPTDGERERMVTVAEGWAADEETAILVASELNEAGDMSIRVTGRIAPNEAPILDTDADDPTAMTSLSISWLYNLWQGTADLDPYIVYVVNSQPADGLNAIYAPPPLPAVAVNWLNVFYAIEWMVFGGFALFLWYRIVKDAWEREIDTMDAGGPSSQDR